MAKPASIRLFDRIFFIALAILLLHQFVILDALYDPDIALLSKVDAGSVMDIAIVLICELGLWYLVSPKGKSWARSAFITLTVGVILLNLWVGYENAAIVPVDTVILAVAIGLEIAQIALLLREDASRWFHACKASDA